MTLDEAIKQAEERAKTDCSECAKEHEQIAEWLKELKSIKEYIEPLMSFNTHNLYLEKLKELVFK